MLPPLPDEVPKSPVARKASGVFNSIGIRFLFHIFLYLYIISKTIGKASGDLIKTVMDDVVSTFTKKHVEEDPFFEEHLAKVTTNESQLKVVHKKMDVVSKNKKGLHSLSALGKYI